MQIDYPDLQPVADSGPEGYIVELYQKLGWDRESNLDPKKIAVHPALWNEICRAFNQSSNERTAGLIWMNYGPSADGKVPYGKIEIEDGAFGREAPTLSEADKASIDAAASALHTVEGTVVHLDADRQDGNEALLQTAYDARTAAPEGFLQSVETKIDGIWQGRIDAAIDQIIERSGVVRDADGPYGAARDYITGKYEFKPPYTHYLTQDMKVNLLLGTEIEANLSFSSLARARDGLLQPGGLGDEALDNGLTWLVGQQGHTLDELRDAMADYGAHSYNVCEELHGPFLTSVAAELSELPNRTGTLTVLVRLSMCDMAKTLDPGVAVDLYRSFGHAC